LNVCLNVLDNANDFNVPFVFIYVIAYVFHAIMSFVELLRFFVVGRSVIMEFLEEEKLEFLKYSISYLEQ
jgi:hypothetical protein